ncbi:hypothetical protein 10S11_23 [uncultured Caudovirales phage]|uniref:Uncharacterized protein n=1 Tax=uncultured Caudovirales phage TaxID=2100421 RepID=A0A2H4J057_9CAUD|nr:hypothetical protein 10S11_23 [uncultured Caudovirales phage]
MSKLKAKKIIKAINKGIALNPSEININGVKKIEVDGAFEEIPFEKTLKVLIYLEDSSNKIAIDSKMQGTSYSSNRYKMIADKDAELDVNPKKSVEFDCIEGHMEIEAAYPIVVEDTICGYICDLKRVS